MTSQGSVIFYDGSAWRDQFVTDGRLLSVSALDASHVWAAGDNGIYFFDGSSWRQQLNGVAISDVSATHTGIAWAVGKDSTYFFDGSSWITNSMISITGGYHARIFALDRSHVWLVHGASGDEVYFFDGSSWHRQYKTPPYSYVTESGGDYGEDLTDICAVDEKHAWAVSDKGGIFFFNGESWSMQYRAHRYSDTKENSSKGLVSVSFLSVSAPDASHI